MGLLDRSAELPALPVSKGLLGKAYTTKNTTQESSDAPDISGNRKIQKKKIICFKDFLDLSTSLLEKIHSDKVAFLYPVKDYYAPFLIKGFDTTTLNKFRIKQEQIEPESTKISRNSLKNVLSLREYLNQENEYFYFLKPGNGNFVILVQDENSLKALSIFTDITLQLSEEMHNILPQTSQSPLLKSESEIDHFLSSATLDNLFVNRFSFSLSRLVGILAIPIHFMQEIFLITIINNVIFKTFKHTAYSVKTGDNIDLYLLSASQQNSLLLEHQINRTLSTYFVGRDSNALKLVSFVDKRQ